MGRHLPCPAQAITQHWSPDTVRNISHISTLPIRFTFTLPGEFLPGVFWRLSLRLIDAGWSDCAPDVMILLSSDCDRDTPPPAWILIPRSVSPWAWSAHIQRSWWKYQIFDILSLSIAQLFLALLYLLYSCPLVTFPQHHHFKFEKQPWHINSVFCRDTLETWFEIKGKINAGTRVRCPTRSFINIPEMRRTKPRMTEMNGIKKKPEPGAGPSSC